MTRTGRELLLAAGIVCIVLSLPVVLFTGWFLYDGVVTYPAQQERWEAFEALRRGDPATADAEWTRVAAQRGWPTHRPPKRTATDVLTQFIMAAFCGVTGGALLGGAGVMLMLATKSHKTPPAGPPRGRGG